MTLEEARKELIYFERGTSGGFMTKLIEAMQRADEENLFKLSIVYPELVQAFREKYKKIR